MSDETKIETKDTKDEKPSAAPKAAATVKIALEPGPVVREIDGHEWSEAAGWAQDVPLELAANLLAYPRPGWSLVERPSAATLKALAGLLGVEPGNIAVAGEPVRLSRTLTEIVGDRDRVAQLRDLGVTVKGLAAMTDGDIADLAFRSGSAVQEIAGWVEQAKAA